MPKTTATNVFKYCLEFFTTVDMAFFWSAKLAKLIWIMPCLLRSINIACDYSHLLQTGTWLLLTHSFPFLFQTEFSTKWEWPIKPVIVNWLWKNALPDLPIFASQLASKIYCFLKIHFSFLQVGFHLCRHCYCIRKN